MRRRARAARFGLAYWNRSGHLSVSDGDGVVTVGAEVWPRPCPICVELLGERPALVTDAGKVFPIVEDPS